MSKDYESERPPGEYRVDRMEVEVLRGTELTITNRPKACPLFFWLILVQYLVFKEQCRSEQDALHACMGSHHAMDR